MSAHPGTPIKGSTADERFDPDVLRVGEYYVINFTNI